MSFNLNHYHKPIRLVLFILCLLPSIQLAYGFYNGGLGINPFATLAQQSGHLTMLFILVTLAITPVRRWLTNIFRLFPELRWGKRLGDWNVMIRARRMFGLYAFYYGSIHMWVYLYLEMDFFWQDIWTELLDRVFILIGLSSWLCILLLALTSPHFIRKRMHANWRRLHRLMYLLAILATTHHYLAVKITDSTPRLYMMLVTIFLVHRFLVAYVRNLRRSADNGLEATR